MTEAPPQPAPPYRLAPCVALLGAIAGKSAPLATRRKIGLFMEQALSADRHGGEHRGVSAFFQHRSAWQYVVEEVRLERRLNNRSILEWAKARGRNGGHLGVRPMTEDEIAADLDAIEAELRGAPKQHYPASRLSKDEQRSALCANLPGSAEDLAGRIGGIDKRTVYRRLGELVKSGAVVRDGCNYWRAAQ
jgi:hypothetical protein